MRRLFAPGDKFQNIAGELEFLGANKVPTKNGYIGVWKCFCGKIFETMNYDVKNHKTKSCGCWKELQISLALKDEERENLRTIWNHIKSRCYNKKNPAYCNYGGRGIRMSRQWKNNSNKFINDIIKNLGYKLDGYDLDRVDVNGDYELKNVRWATRKINCQNKRNNNLITINNETKTVSEWESLNNLNTGIISRRIKLGWSGEKLLSLPSVRNYNNQNYLYKIWSSIKDRCFNENNIGFSNYGKRGISVFGSWVDNYEVFEKYILDALGDRPTGRHQLDRINNDGNYEPGNLKWSTIGENNRNKSTCKLITLFGETKTLSEWAEISGIKIGTLSARLKYNWNDNRLLSPVNKRKFSDLEVQQIRQENKTLSINELSIKYKSSKTVIQNIIRARGAYKK